jgi:hypothetical protein
VARRIVRYYEGQNIVLDKAEHRRCIAIYLKGVDKAVLINNIKNLIPEHIDFCFGASNVKAILQNKEDLKREFLDVWLNRTRYPMAELIGFSGLEGTILYIVLRKDRCVSIKLFGYRESAPLVNMTLTQDHIDFFLGSGDIEVKLSGQEKREDINSWLHYSKYPMSKLLGFYGPEGTLLYIVLKKDLFL